MRSDIKVSNALNPHWNVARPPIITLIYIWKILLSPSEELNHLFQKQYHCCVNTNATLVKESEAVYNFRWFLGTNQLQNASLIPVGIK